MFLYSRCYSFYIVSIHFLCVDIFCMFSNLSLRYFLNYSCLCFLNTYFVFNFFRINGAFLIVHSIMQWSDRNSNLVRLWIQFSSSLWYIQSKALPALCVGNSISCTKLNVCNISFILLLSICSKRIHWCIKVPCYYWLRNFPCSSDVKNSLNSSTNAQIFCGFFFE